MKCVLKEETVLLRFHSLLELTSVFNLEKRQVFQSLGHYQNGKYKGLWSNSKCTELAPGLLNYCYSLRFPPPSFTLIADPTNRKE